MQAHDLRLVSCKGQRKRKFFSRRAANDHLESSRIFVHKSHSREAAQALFHLPVPRDAFVDRRLSRGLFQKRSHGSLSSVEGVEVLACELSVRRRWQHIGRPKRERQQNECRKNDTESIHVVCWTRRITVG